MFVIPGDLCLQVSLSPFGTDQEGLSGSLKHFDRSRFLRQILYSLTPKRRPGVAPRNNKFEQEAIRKKSRKSAREHHVIRYKSAHGTDIGY